MSTPGSVPSESKPSPTGIIAGFLSSINAERREGERKGGEGREEEGMNGKGRGGVGRERRERERRKKANFLHIS